MNQVTSESHEPLTQNEFNERVWEQIAQSGDGTLKVASEQSSSWVKRQIREDGFARLILPFETVTDADLTKHEDSELPVVIGEMEPDSAGAVTLSFNDGPESAFFRGENFITYFSKISTPEFTKNIDELRTWRYNLRDIVTDNAIRDMSAEEDGRFIKTVDKITGSTADQAGESGAVQYYEVTGGITRSTYKETLRMLTRRNLNNGVFLMNRDTAVEFAGWTRDEIGGDLSQDIFNKGISALKEARIMGVRHIFTIKRDLVPDNVVYQFAEPDYLGKAYILSDITMYVKKERDMIRFSAEEKIGMTIANVAAVNRCIFTA